MKTQFWAASAALSAILVASSANAQTVSNGYVGLSYTDIEQAHIIAGRAVGSFDLSKTVELQLDGDIASVDTGISGIGSTTVWGPTAHLFMDKDSFKGGAFLGYEDLDGANLTAYGVEGRIAASDNVSLGLVAGLGSINVSGASGSVDVTALRGEASFFQNDNLRWDVSVGSFKLNPPGTSADFTFTTYGLGGEYQMMKSPVSFTFGWEHGSISGSSSNAYTLGVRRTFGGSLKDRDRNSAPFNGVGANYGGSEGVLFGALLGVVGGNIDPCDFDMQCMAE